MKKAISLILVFVLCLSLCACGGVDERYTTLIECLDNHDYEGAYMEVAALRQQAIDNGDIVVLEPQEEDYELVRRYRSVASFLMNYTPDGYQGIHNQATDEYLEGNDALAFAYAELQALEAVDQWLNSEYFDFEDDYPTDRAALLSRFSILENQLIKSTASYVDNMGNENTENLQTMYYDASGTVTAKQIEWRAGKLVWENLYTQSGHYRYTYNDAGVVTETRITDRENTNVYAVVTPEYDNAGNLVKETITDNDGEKVFTYSYDEKGNRTQMEYSDDWSDYVVEYTYDAEGRLIQKERKTIGEFNDEEFVDYLITTVYTRDGAGNLVSAEVLTQDYGWTYSGAGFDVYVTSEKKDTVTYTNDAEGRLVREDWQYGETVTKDGETQKPDYTTQTTEYFYGDYYIFN